MSYAVSVEDEKQVRKMIVDVLEANYNSAPLPPPFDKLEDEARYAVILLVYALAMTEEFDPEMPR